MKPITSLKLSISLFCVSFFWGTTYLAVRIAIQTIPAIYIVGIRHFIAGLLLLSYLLITKSLVWPSWSRVRHNIITASFLLVLGNGLTAFGEHTVPSGLTALLTTLSPLLVMLISLVSGKEKISSKIIWGVVLGFVGMLLIFYNSLTDLANPEYRIGIFSILIAILCWSLGTVYSKSGSAKSTNILVDLCTQMLFAGTGLLLLGLITGVPFEVSAWKTNHILAVFYLTFFGSIAGYISYLYALSKMPSTSVAVFTYFNVVVALSLGWLILDEKVTLRLIFATVFILLGVLMANYKRKTVILAVQDVIIEK
jgi:drug/metabolite transporter (DMT)-like permease